MAAKFMCPGCGAKNDPSSRRCRICTAVINAEAPEGASADSAAVASAPTVDTHFDVDQINQQLKPARTRFAGGEDGLAARIAAAKGGSAPSPSSPGAPDAGHSTGFAGDEPFDPDALFRYMD